MYALWGILSHTYGWAYLEPYYIVCCHHELVSLLSFNIDTYELLTHELVARLLRCLQSKTSRIHFVQCRCSILFIHRATVLVAVNWGSEATAERSEAIARPSRGQCEGLDTTTTHCAAVRDTSKLITPYLEQVFLEHVLAALPRTLWYMRSMCIRHLHLHTICQEYPSFIFYMFRHMLINVENIADEVLYVQAVYRPSQYASAHVFTAGFLNCPCVHGVVDVFPR